MAAEIRLTFTDGSKRLFANTKEFIIDETIGFLWISYTTKAFSSYVNLDKIQYFERIEYSDED